MVAQIRIPWNYRVSERPYRDSRHNNKLLRLTLLILNFFEIEEEVPGSFIFILLYAKKYKVFSPLKEDLVIFRFELFHFFRALFKININIIGHIRSVPPP